MTESEAFEAAVDNFLMREFGPRCTWKAVTALLQNQGFRVVALHPVNFRQSLAQGQEWAIKTMNDLVSLIVDLGFLSIMIPVVTCKLASQTRRPDDMLRVVINWFGVQFPELDFMVAIRTKTSPDNQVTRVVYGTPPKEG